VPGAAGHGDLTDNDRNAPCSTISAAGRARPRCFAGLTVNNLLLLVDLIVVPAVDLSLWRSTIALAAMVVLIYGLVWETR